MKFTRIGHNNTPYISDGVLYQAIESYIEKNNIPKNITIKKIELTEKELLMKEKESDVLLKKAETAINDLMKDTMNIREKCNNLSMKLKQHFNR